MINGLEKPTSGTVTVLGQQVSHLSEAKLRPLRTRIGMVFQQFNLLTSRTVAGNIEFALDTAGWPRSTRRARVAELLEFVGLADKAKHYPEQLSGGQKQRVGIARALATNPSLLLADEATSALDPETTHEVLEVLRRVNEELGITIVVITHEMDVIRSIADKVAVMEAGKVVEYGSVYDVFSDPQTAVAKRFVSTSLRNTPNEVEAQELLDAAPGRLFTVDLSEDSGFFGAASKARQRGVSVQPVHAGIATLQSHSFGKMTVRLNGDDDAINEFLHTLQSTTDIEEITR